MNMQELFNTIKLLKKPGDHLLVPQLGDYANIIYMALDGTTKQVVDSPHIRRVIDCIRIEQERLDKWFVEYLKDCRKREFFYENGAKTYIKGDMTPTPADNQVPVKVISFADMFKDFNGGCYHLAEGDKYQRSGFVGRSVLFCDLCGKQLVVKYSGSEWTNCCTDRNCYNY